MSKQLCWEVETSARELHSSEFACSLIPFVHKELIMLSVFGESTQEEVPDPSTYHDSWSKRAVCDS